MRRVTAVVFQCRPLSSEYFPPKVRHEGIKGCVMTYRGFGQIAAGLLGVAFSSTSSAAILATCGASDGFAYYLDAGGHSGWEPDKISSGRLVFTSDDKGNVNLLFKDASGGTTDAAADGAKITLSRIDPKAGEFSIVVAYSETGVTEAYNVVSPVEGGRVLLWTSSKVHMRGVVTKVAAYTSRCD